MRVTPTIGVHTTDSKLTMPKSLEPVLDRIETEGCPICEAAVFGYEIAGPDLIRIHPCGHNYNPLTDDAIDPAIQAEVIRGL